MIIPILTSVRFLIITLFFIVCFSANAQQNTLAFKHLSLNEGLSQSPIFSIKQDKFGFIWIGSRKGLIRFDGYEFKTYVNDHYDNKNNRQRDINAIYEDAKNNIWLGTSSGLYHFDRNSEQFTYVPLLGVKFISCLLPAVDNKLWAGTDQGLRLIDCKTRTEKNFKNPRLNNFIYSIFEDQKGLLWCGSRNGLICLDVAKDAIMPLPPALKNKLALSSRKIVDIKQDLEGDLWFGTEESGLFLFRQTNSECINYLQSDENKNSILSDFVRDVFINGGDEVWIGTRNGLSILNKRTQKFTNHTHSSERKESLSHNTIWNIMKDMHGSIWITTYAGGINIYNRANANFSNIGERIGKGVGLNQPLVNAISGDEVGGIWIGTDGGGLNYINTKKNIAKYYPVQDHSKLKNSNIVKAISKDIFGTLWLGTLDGLAKFDAHTGSIKYISFSAVNSYPNIRINALLTTNKGIWAASDVDGLKFVSFDGTIKEYRNQQYGNSISSNYTNALLKTKLNGIWIGTNYGLNYLDDSNGSFKTYNNNSSTKDFKSNVILCLFEDSKHRLWLGSRAGLQLFNEYGNNDFITEKEGLANDVVQAITEDKTGSLWVSTNNGISKITFKKNSSRVKAGNYQITSYTSADGLISNQWMTNAVYRTNQGELYFGGVNGISSFKPETIIQNKYPPTLAITEFMIHNKLVNNNSERSPLSHPIESTSSMVLAYNQNFITFKFAALNFINTQKNNYAYKMEGLNYNEEWNYSGSQRLAVYTGLEPGDYIFKVKAANNDGFWNNIPRTIKIRVLPPFWLTWWAYLFYSIVAISIFYLIIRFFRRQAKLESDLYYEHLQFERQQELHQMKLNFFTNISHEIRTPLTLIAAPVEKLLQENEDNGYLNKQLMTIRNNTNRLLKLVNELMDFRKAETGNMKLEINEGDFNEFAQEAFSFFNEAAEAKHISYEFDGLNKSIYVYFDHNQMEKVLFNLLSNAFKFTPDAGRISLKITENENSVGVHISDSGIGIPYEAQEKLFSNFYQGGKYNPKHIGTGIGLAFSKSIVDLHHGNITFNSIPEGQAELPKTCFSVSLLKGNSHFEPNELLVSGQTESITDSYGGREKVHAPKDYYMQGILATDAEYSKYSILVVEDNDEVREFIMESLKNHYRVSGSKNGRLGFDSAVQEIPDLIITDVMMPEIDGMELCKMLKQDERTSHIPVIILTARAAETHQISGLETGANAYISKPFSLQILQLNIRNLLTARAAMQKKFSQQVTLQPKDVVISSNDGKFLNKLLSIIEEKIDEPNFGVAQLSIEIGMSQPVLYRKIKALSDCSVADFIKSIRLKKAALLLAQNKMSIAEVAYAVGFNNRKHFSKEFRKQYGYSPTMFLAEQLDQILEINN